MNQLSREMLECQISLGALKLAPGGKHAAWVVTQPNATEDKYQYWLHAAHLESGKTFPLTAGGGENSFCWLDETALIFPALRREVDKKAAAEGEPLTVFHRIDITGGEAQELFRVPLRGASALATVGDSVLLAAGYESSLPDYTELDEPGKADYRKKITERKQFLEGTERRYRFDGLGYINGVRKRLYLYHLPTGALKAITGPQLNVGELALSADQSTLAYCGEVPQRNGESATHGVFLYDFSSGQTRTLLADTGYQIGRMALFGGKVHFWGHLYPDNGARCVLDWVTLSLADGTMEKLPQGDYTVTSSYTSDATRLQGLTVVATAEALYLLRYHRRVSQIYRYTGQGAPEAISDASLKVNFFDISGDTLVCAGFDRLGLLEVFDLNGGAPKRLTDYTASLAYTPSPPQPMGFVNSDGIEIDGWLVRPASTPGEKLPAVLMIHGGPHSEYSDILLHDAQYLAARGYAVMTCNPRGSIGRGPEFANIVGKYGTIDYQDVTEFVDHVLARCPDLDIERLGVTGASYGGYMTNWIITHSQRFKAAVSQCCVSNWHSMYYVCDIPDFVRAEMGGTPSEIPEEYHRASPVSYVENIRTPTLFLQYDADFRCPIDQGIQMYNGVLMNGVEAKIVFFSGDNHTMIMTGKPSSRIRRQEELAGWFDKYLT